VIGGRSLHTPKKLGEILRSTGMHPNDGLPSTPAHGETAGDYDRRMSRFLDPLVLGPPGVCDACGRYCCTLDQVGIPCYHCERGVFMHRTFWTFSACPFCSGAGNTGCLACQGSCIVATPDEAFDPLALAADRRCAVERYCVGVVPAAVASVPVD
jgi:hypothetical protein